MPVTDTMPLQTNGKRLYSIQASHINAATPKKVHRRCSHAPAGRFGYSMLRVVDGSPATAGRLCRGYSKNAGDLPSLKLRHGGHSCLYPPSGIYGKQLFSSCIVTGL